ncbi:MAG: UDP-glucose/GDP-mannose dehydrogenase family protein [Rickettsiales bacterium]|nr:UDP-glucose/GDP-mannose dehydrogenase family protein [Rickettsiales bacterium]
MNITIIGSGYVGLVSGICLAKIGHKITCVDKDENKITQLKSNIIPIFEPGLKELLQEAKEKENISFTTNLQEALHSSNVVFIAVGTPQDEDGSADLSYVLGAAKEIAQQSNNYKLIVTKSTVPAGTGKKIKKLIEEENPHIKFDVASNPEFLREGVAINDFLEPDRIVIGTDNEKSLKILQEVYQYFPKEKLVSSDIITAELIKYASNSFLATKISFINEMADLCEIVGGDIKKLSYAMGLDERIGNKFLNPGPGFGGSCFPKDIMAILNIANQNNVNLSLINSVITSNKNRAIKMVNKAKKHLNNNLKNKKISILGLAFKANTDDIRYSPAIQLIRELHKEGSLIKCHDFAALKNSQRELADLKNIQYFQDQYEAISDSDLIIITTEWEEYKKLNFDKIKTLTNCKTVLDLRNLFEPSAIDALDFNYDYIGNKNI